MTGFVKTENMEAVLAVFAWDIPRRIKKLTCWLAVLALALMLSAACNLYLLLTFSARCGVTLPAPQMAAPCVPSARGEEYECQSPLP